MYLRKKKEKKYFPLSSFFDSKFKFLFLHKWHSTEEVIEDTDHHIIEDGEDIKLIIFFKKIKF